ncbi:hypothetical protein JT359_00255 [Candidatus Poribacteria bacterium]|nr:hypothetical protein [Candidatus Poribacteria bacterium]
MLNIQNNGATINSIAFWGDENIHTSELWASVKDNIDFDEEGYLIFDDVVLSKIHSKRIEIVRFQWIGSDKKVIQGIGIITCLYVNPKTHEYWVIDYRIFDKDHDGKSKIDTLIRFNTA